MKTNKKGISLIVLIVTIIVVIILAAAVIFTISKNNPIESAKEARFKEDVRSFQDDLSMSISKDYTSKQGQRDEKFNADKYTNGGEVDSIYTYIPSYTSKYDGKFKIVNDELVYIKTDENEYNWCKELGITVEDPPNAITDWEYSLDDTANTITLTRYIGTSETVVVPETYSIDGTTYTVEFGEVNYTGETSSGMKHYKGIFTDYSGYLNYQFDGTEVVNLTLPNSMETLPDKLLTGCKKLKNVKLPNNIKSISDSQFYYCSGIEEIVIPNTVTNIGNSAFGYSNLKNITIPNSVISIGTSAFCNCSNLVSVTLSNNIANIQSRTFVGCSSLKNITIPSSVTSIDEGAFWGCSGLENMTIPSSVTSIGASAFYECSSLKEIIIPYGVTSMDQNVFQKCSNLTNITVSNSVTNIGDYIFSTCDNLTNINYQGTTSQWNNISKSVNWNTNSSVTTITCTDGTITL